MVHHLYFAACDSQGGIYHYTMENGNISFLEKTVCDRPMYLDVRRNSMQVLLRAPFEHINCDVDNECRCTEILEKLYRKNSGLVEYKVDSNGRLSNPSEILNTKGIVACHLCRYADKTFVANYVSGSVFSSDGQLREHSGSSVHQTRQEAPHVHFVQPSPDESCLFAVDLGTDSIYSYDENLNLLSTAYVPLGCGARHLAYSADGKTVFCVNELDSSVSVFSYEKSRLKLLQTVKVLDKPMQGNTAAAIRVQGEYIYVSNRGADVISCLRWDGKQLSLCSLTPCGGVSPRDFLIVENMMFITNEKTNNVTVFKVNGAELKKEEVELEMPSPLCVVELV